ncbi:juxtaposed with another zinc finger protein 1-like [Toxorhynchites rutilus septentrionalis]|uniref:juxtaposed with another zinc finger protein 1-like n=1 Tax=Toxorhynchites rutilus septentrionalis TaxID=329112 RepID=UPI00247849A7|nr:juxtaposed with another zinc finger protein 1-like [Toxorhynchites rutilus septentrionalis]
MAVFLVNICKFNGCGISFPTFGDLIKHIEDTHVDYASPVHGQLEESESICLPMSHVLRFDTDPFCTVQSFVDTSVSVTSSDIEIDDDDKTDSGSEDSNDSWAMQELSPELIMQSWKYYPTDDSDLSFSDGKTVGCPVPGCLKRYKSINGLKYHSKNSHKKESILVRKGFSCHCGKSYMTCSMLRNHQLRVHKKPAVAQHLSP